MSDIIVITFHNNIPGQSTYFESYNYNVDSVQIDDTPSTLGWTREGYDFLYWCNTQDGTGNTKIYVRSGGPYTRLYDDATLYAIWERTTAPAVNKVLYNGIPIIDLTADTVEPTNLMRGVLAHDRSGELVEGTFETYTKAEIDDLLDAKEDVGVCIQNGTSEDIELGGLLALPTSQALLRIKMVTGSTRVKTADANQSGTIAINAETGWTPLCACGYYLSQSWCFMSKCIVENDEVAYNIRYTGSQTAYQNVNIQVPVLCIRTALPTT